MSNAKFAQVASLVGDPARAAMLHELMDGRALTASELARGAGVTPQTASGHLAQLTASGLLLVEKQGRHRYHRLASAEVAHMLEGIMQVATSGILAGPRMTVGPRDAAMRAARTCYDHLAGRLGVAIADALVARGFVELSSDGGLVTNSGDAFFADVGIDIAHPTPHVGKRPGRVLCRPCLDWSERRPHLAGALGAAIRDEAFDQGWIRHLDGTRAVAVTPKGRRVFTEKFGAEIG
jgi:DNA-binding transcriptional ArsR family regulator